MCDYIKIAITRLEELGNMMNDDYYSACQTGINALKQTYPIDFKMDNMGYICPTCGEKIEKPAMIEEVKENEDDIYIGFCWFCGQAIKW